MKFSISIYFIIFICAVLGQAIAQPKVPASSKQVVSYKTALRFIKAGASLRDAKMYPLAEWYLQRAIPVVKSEKDEYWLAAAYENLGLLARDQNQPGVAVNYLGKALKGYKSLGAATSAQVVRQVLSSLRGNTEDQAIFGGIDVGSKGVKMSVIKLQFSATGEAQFTILKADSRNPDAMSGTPTALAETVKVVHGYLDSLLQARHIPKNRVFVVGSSGLKAELIKKNKLADLQRALRAELSSVWTDSIPFIDAKTEARLTIKGTLPRTEWQSTATIDIGSGNTKGGYFTNDNQFEYIDMLGTVSMSDFIQKAGKPVDQSAQAVYDGEVRAAVAESMGYKPEFENRSRVYLMGGIVYALVTYLHPEQVNKSLVQFSYKDAVKLQEMAINNYEALTNPDLSGIDSDATVASAQREARNVREKVFKRDQLIAGATLLRGILEECRNNNPGQKEFIFHRNGQIGWISGYIIEATEKEYAQTKEQ